LNSNRGTISSAPSYVSIDPGDSEHIIIAIDTQGVGAGAQSVKPYIIYRQVPRDYTHDYTT
jgi:hypothetical protein